MRSDVTVVIRSVGERTEQYCKTIIKGQINSQAIFIVQERPFWKAVDRMFKIGIDENRPWTLAVDADVLLTAGAIDRMVENCSKISADYFFYQGHILDKFHQKIRGGGPHLYRTNSLETAAKYVEAAAKTMRPESGIQSFMENEGHFVFQSKEIYGIHDFYQFKADIFRKAFFNAKKQNDKVVDHFNNCVSNINDPDFRIYLEGLTQGLLHEEVVLADSSFFDCKVNFSEEPGEPDFLKPDWHINEYQQSHLNWRNELKLYDTKNKAVLMKKSLLSRIIRKLS